jgi:O-antigen/teichoic acid export membrane protein
MSLRSKVAKGLLWSVIQDWGAHALNFVVFFTLARLLEPQVFGLVALAQVFLKFIQAITRQGFTQAIIQHDQLDKKHLDTAFWSNLLISSFLTSICIALSKSISVWFHEPQIAYVIPFLSVNFILVALNDVQRALLSRDLEFKSLATRTLIATPVGGIVGVSFAFLGFGVWSLIAKQIIYNLTEVIVLWHASKWRPSLNFSITHFKELFSFQINIVGINILNVVNGQGDNFLIGYFLGAEALGYYVVAYQLTSTAISLTDGTIQKIALPLFSRIKNEPSKLRKIINRIIQISSLIAFPIFGGIAILTPELIKVFFGEQWISAIPTMRILALGGLQHSIFSFLGILITALGKPQFNLWLNLLDTTFRGGGFAVAVRFGIVAVAIVHVAAIYIFSGVRLTLVRQMLSINIFNCLQPLILPLIGMLSMSISIQVCRYSIGGLFNHAILLFLYLILGTASYLVSIFLISPRTIYQNMDFLKSALSKQKKEIKI